MLREYAHVRQEARGFRRLFTDDDFDLWIWYDAGPDSPYYGFQLVINQFLGENTVFTWTRKDGGLFAGLLDGDDRGEDVRYKKTPFLALNGCMDRLGVLERFMAHSQDLPGDIRTLVGTAIREFKD